MEYNEALSKGFSGSISGRPVTSIEVKRDRITRSISDVIDKIVYEHGEHVDFTKEIKKIS